MFVTHRAGRALLGWQSRTASSLPKGILGEGKGGSGERLGQSSPGQSLQRMCTDSDHTGTNPLFPDSPPFVCRQLFLSLEVYTYQVEHPCSFS